MRFAPIVPITMLDEIALESYQMVLAPMCQASEEYYDFYRSTPGWKILDNGAAEGVHIHTEDLTALAYDLKADEVIAPDVYGDFEGTAHNLRMFMEGAENHRVMAVIQCSSWTDFDYMFKLALHLRCFSLALPRIMIDRLGPLARLGAAELIRRESEIPIHALGCGKRMSEVRDLARQGIVRGVDSSAPVAMGLDGKGLRDTYVQRQEDFFYRTPNVEAKMNLDTFKAWCKGEQHV